MNRKIIIYQVFTRLFGNRNLTNKRDGSITENGCGKMNDFDDAVLQEIKELGITHIWFTGVIRHATKTDYTAYGIPKQHDAIVKGEAGSPYAITDYYDIDPDIAVDVEHRMQEWEALINRTHQKGMKVIMDFVPNHVAREYHSIKKPVNIRDLGEDDDKEKHFSPQNNFYYCYGQSFAPSFSLKGKDGESYEEYPARATGNDRFDNNPGINDWYETIKLNYGIDYCNAGGKSEHFLPMPNTWKKMADILLFWASKGVDAFRCDMAEMVPVAFWKYATETVKKQYPHIIFIGEVYNPSLYRSYIQNGFDYLYDKVGMYDCVRDVICNHRPASSLTYQWQSLDDINEHMLYFLENHDEQRIASDFFCGDGQKAIPGLIVSALLLRNPLLIYAGQEFGERGMDHEGFSGIDGRTTIFDYWTVSTLYRGYFNRRQLSATELTLYNEYHKILHIASTEKAISEGMFFDLMYANPHSTSFNPHSLYAFLRKHEDDLLLIIVNFSSNDVETQVVIPAHAFDYLGINEKKVFAVDLMNRETKSVTLRKDHPVAFSVKAFSGVVLKMNVR